MCLDIFLKNRVVVLLNIIIGAFSAASVCFVIYKISNIAAKNVRLDIYDWTVYYVLGLFAFILSGTVANYLSCRLNAALLSEVRNTITSRILSASYDILERAGGHKLYAILTTDTQNISAALFIAPQLIFNLLIFIACLVYLFVIAVDVFFVMLIVLCGGILVNRFINKFALIESNSLRTAQDFLHKQYKMLIDGAKELSNNSKRKNNFIHNSFNVAVADAKQYELRSEFFWGLTALVSQFFLFFGLGVAIFYCSIYSSLDNGQLSLFVFISTYLLGPARYIIVSIGFVSKALISMRRINDIGLSISSRKKVCLPVFEIPSNWSKIVFDNVDFYYEEESLDKGFGLGPINFELHRGELIFIRGGNGSGKSTFAKIMVGLFPLNSGKILVDNNIVSADTDISYKNLFSVVYSDFYLFDSALNKHGNPAHDHVVRQLLVQFDLANKVTVKNGVFSTTKLSHGQRKRLALVIACAEDSDIYVLDEWAADQDPNYRKLFYENLLFDLKAKGKTVVVITHDEAFYHLPDKLYSFDNGKMQRCDI